MKNKVKRHRLPSLAYIEYSKVPKRYRKSIRSYLLHRIRCLKQARKEIDERPQEFGHFKELIWGRQAEAEEVLRFIDLVNGRTGVSRYWTPKK